MVGEWGALAPLVCISPTMPSKLCNINPSNKDNCIILQVVTFDGGEYVSMAGEFNEFRKVTVAFAFLFVIFFMSEFSDFTHSKLLILISNLNFCGFIYF